MNRLGVRSCLACMLVLSGLVALAACDQRMAEQPKYQPLETAPGFAGEPAMRQPPPHTVAADAEVAPASPPQELTAAELERGRERYEIYCTPCHGLLGDGRGLVVQRGFPAPPSLHIERLRNADARQIYDVITEGYGVMYDYRGRVSGRDRWRIAWYVKALQLSQHLDVARFPHYAPGTGNPAAADSPDKGAAR